MQKFVHNFKDVNILLPQSLAASWGGNLPFISLKNAGHASILIELGTVTGNEPVITLQQAKNVEGSGNKTLGFTKVWEQTPSDSPDDIKDQWRELDVTGNSFSTTAQTRYRIELDSDQLDVDNGFDCIRLHGAIGTSARIAASAQLSNLRYTGEGSLSQPSAKIN